MANPEKLRDKLMSAYYTLGDRLIYLNSSDPFRVVVDRGGVKQRESYEAAAFLGIATAITPGGTILYVGGHGDGKTSLAKALGVMLAGIPESEIETNVLRLHPEQTEEKIVARPDMAKLLDRNNPQEVPVPRKWTLGRWKVADEFNRASPEVMNMFFAGIEEGVWKYADAAFVVPDQRVFGTINPFGEGTFEVDPAMYDRFVLSCPVEPASMADLAEIAGRKDVSLHGRGLEQITTFEDLTEATKEADKIPIDSDAMLQMTYFEKELSLCIKADGDKAKGRGKPSEGLCNKCHYATDIKVSAVGIKNPCQMTDAHISTRTHERWSKVAKRVAWLLDQPSVSVEVAGAMAPYALYHRIKPNDQILMKDPYNGNLMEMVGDAWKISMRKLDQRLEAEKIYLTLLEGKGNSSDVQKLQQFDDLIVKLDMVPFVEGMDSALYRDNVGRIGGMKNPQELATMMLDLRRPEYRSLPLGAQNQLRALIRERLRNPGSGQR